MLNPPAAILGNKGRRQDFHRERPGRTTVGDDRAGRGTRSAIGM